MIIGKINELDFLIDPLRKVITINNKNILQSNTLKYLKSEW